MKLMLSILESNTRQFISTYNFDVTFMLFIYFKRHSSATSFLQNKNAIYKQSSFDKL